VTRQPVVGGGLSAARRHDGLDPTLVRSVPITSLPTVHETFVVLIELALMNVPFTFATTLPAQRVAAGTPTAWPALVEDGAHSAIAQATARSRGRMPGILPLRERANTLRYRREAE
jgi:hypothetical protein